MILIIHGTALYIIFKELFLTSFINLPLQVHTYGKKEKMIKAFEYIVTVSFFVEEKNEIYKLFIEDKFLWKN
jgi:hypothetical protein